MSTSFVVQEFALVKYSTLMHFVRRCASVALLLVGAVVGPILAGVISDRFGRRRTLVAYYLLSSRGALVQWGALIALLVAAVVVFAVSESGKQLIAFGRDAWREVKKVVWPARKEAIQMTAYVFAFVLVMSLFLWLTDKTVEWLFYDLILGWRK